jgi:hypothetical protein
VYRSAALVQVKHRLAGGAEHCPQSSHYLLRSTIDRYDCSEAAAPMLDERPEQANEAEGAAS